MTSDAIAVLPLAYAGETGGSSGLARSVGWIAVAQAAAALAGSTTELIVSRQAWPWLVGVMLIPSGLVLAGGLVVAGPRPRGRRLLIVAELFWAAARVLLLAVTTWQTWHALVNGPGRTVADGYFARAAVGVLQPLVLPVAVVVLLRRPEVRAGFGGRVAGTVD